MFEYSKAEKAELDDYIDMLMYSTHGHVEFNEVPDIDIDLVKMCELESHLEEFELLLQTWEDMAGAALQDDTDDLVTLGFDTTLEPEQSSGIEHYLGAATAEPTWGYPSADCKVGQTLTTALSKLGR